MKIVTCPKCKQKVMKTGYFCPSCGKRLKKVFYKRISFYIFIVILGIIIVLCNINPITKKSYDKVIHNQKVIYHERNISNLEKELIEDEIKFKTVYKGKYINITGTISEINESKNIFNLKDQKNDDDYIDIICTVKDIKNLNNNDVITINGQITKVDMTTIYINVDEIITENK